MARRSDLDLRQLVEYISRENTSAAVALGEEIIRKSMLLAEHPRLGRILQKLKNDNVRELVIAPYRLIYEIHDATKTIYVTVLWHGARQEPEIK